MSGVLWIDELLSPAGQTLLAELADEDALDARGVQLITRLRARYPADLVAAAVTQSALRRRARVKFSRADGMYFTAAGLEQASTERMARHHASRFAGRGTIADCCSGIGGDLIALAAEHSVVAIDIDPVHARLGAINAGVYGVGPRVLPMVGDVREFSFDVVDAAFVDPARRSAAGRFREGESEPSLGWCFALGDGERAVGVKASPALAREVVPAGWEMELVSEGRELKESLLWSPVLATGRRRATVLAGEARTLVEDEAAVTPVAAPGAYLLDVDPAVTRAGLVDELGAMLGPCWKIDERIGFLSSDAPMDTVFGRSLRVEASLPWNLKRLNEALQSLDVGRADIRKRGSPVDVDELQRRLKLRGSRAALVVLTRAAGRPWAFVCVEADLQHALT